ncbi:hypothetical protein SNARM312S_02467 [Streptomyces narbonensis]
MSASPSACWPAALRRPLSTYTATTVKCPSTPGVPAALTLTADRTGLFEVETHESGLLLTQLVVR